jgi:hypothetical protein
MQLLRGAAPWRSARPRKSRLRHQARRSAPDARHGRVPGAVAMLHSSGGAQVELRLDDGLQLTPGHWRRRWPARRRGLVTCPGGPATAYDDLDLWLATGLPGYAVMAASRQAIDHGNAHSGPNSRTSEPACREQSQPADRFPSKGQSTDPCMTEAHRGLPPCRPHRPSRHGRARPGSPGHTGSRRLVTSLTRFSGLSAASLPRQVISRTSPVRPGRPSLSET